MGIEFLTTAQAAERLGVSVPRILQRIARGELRAERFGRAWMIRPEDLAAVKKKAGGRPAWTAEEDRDILVMQAQGKSLAEIASAVGRTTAAVGKRLSRLRRG